MKTLTKEHQLDLLIQCGVAKLFNENSSYLFGELKGEEKHWFKVAFHANNTLINLVENRLDVENLITYTMLYEALNNGISDMRKTILNDLKK